MVVVLLYKRIKKSKRIKELKRIKKIAGK